LPSSRAPITSLSFLFSFTMVERSPLLVYGVMAFLGFSILRWANAKMLGYSAFFFEFLGSSIMNFVPLPSLLSKVMVPLSVSVSFLTTAKPNP
jgi:hypothetical protein